MFGVGGCACPGYGGNDVSPFSITVGMEQATEISQDTSAYHNSGTIKDQGPYSCPSLGGRHSLCRGIKLKIKLETTNMTILLFVCGGGGVIGIPITLRNI